MVCVSIRSGGALRGLNAAPLNLHRQFNICCVVLLLVSLPVGISPIWVINFLDLDRASAALRRNARGELFRSSAAELRFAPKTPEPAGDFVLAAAPERKRRRFYFYSNSREAARKKGNISLNRAAPEL